MVRDDAEEKHKEREDKKYTKREQK